MGFIHLYTLKFYSKTLTITEINHWDLHLIL